MKIELSPVAYVESTRKLPKDDLWDAEITSIIVDEKKFTTDALIELSNFSHLEVIFYMNLVDEKDIQWGARHPRNNPDWPLVGIFAQRGKNRPNKIGLTRCEILRIDGLRIFVKGLDAVADTPILDIKPWIAEFGPRGHIRQPKWVNQLMEKYWK